MDPNNGNLSSIIVDAMKAKDLTVEKISEMTGISERFIISLINGKYHDLPSLPYLHGYVVKISETLGLDGEEIWEKYFKHNDFLKKSGKHDRLPENRFAIAKINKKTLAIVVVVLLVVAYFSVRSFLAVDISRELSLMGMEDEIIFANESEFLVTGNVSPRYQLTINQKKIYPDTSGNFEEILELNRGFNTVTFVVGGLLGKEGSLIKQVFYESSERTTSTVDEGTLPVDTQ